MAGVEHRRSVRYPTDLPVRYRTDRESPWRRGRIVDLSEHGAAVELYDLAGDSLRGRLELDVSSVVPATKGIVLHVQIRHRKSIGDGLLVGLEFAPTAAEGANLLRLIGLQHLVTDG